MRVPKHWFTKTEIPDVPPWTSRIVTLREDLHRVFFISGTPHLLDQNDVFCVPRGIVETTRFLLIDYEESS